MPGLLRSELALTPVVGFARAARGTAFVDDIRDRDGKVRALPLVMEYDGKVYPQMGLELAAMMLDVDFHDIQITKRRIIIPRKENGAIELPIHLQASPNFKQDVALFDIPMFGSDRWEEMYDKSGGAHVPLGIVWDACLTRHRLLQNNRSADDAIDFILNHDRTDSTIDPRLGIEPARADAYIKHLPDPHDFSARREMISYTLKSLADSGYVDALDAIKDPTPLEKRQREKGNTCRASGAGTCAEGNRRPGSPTQSPAFHRAKAPAQSCDSGRLDGDGRSGG